MRRVSCLVLVLISLAGCVSNLRSGSRALRHSDRRTVVHVLNRLTFGLRPGDADRVQASGLIAYIDNQLHPERLDDAALEARLAPLTALALSPRLFAADYYLPMIAARQ